MFVKLLTEHHLEFLSLKVAEARLSLHLSKCHIVGNHKSRFIFQLVFVAQQTGLCPTGLKTAKTGLSRRRLYNAHQVSFTIA